MRAVTCLGALLLAVPSLVFAIDFKLPFGDEGIDGVLNTTTTFGAQMRTQERSADLVGKSNLDPDVCGRIGFGNNPAPTGTQVVGSPLYQSCQGLFRTQSYPAARLSQVPGQFSLNFDDGNLNYDKHDLTQAPLKITQDITLTRGETGFFARALFFHDFVNDGLKEFHPNRLTSENASRSGFAATTLNNNGLARGDSVPCPADRNPTGEPCGLVYGSGQVVRNKRDSETRRQIGQAIQLLDAVVYGKVPITDHR